MYGPPLPTLLQLEEADQLIRTPSNSNDDLYVIMYAMRNDGLIVTNDLYRKEISGTNRQHWTISSQDLHAYISANSICYTFVRSQFEPNPDHPI